MKSELEGVDEKFLLENFPDAHHDSEAFAETNVRSLRSMQAKDLLESVGINSIPHTPSEIDDYIEKRATQVAVTLFSRDEKYNKKPDYDAHLAVFVFAFQKKLKSLLENS